MNKVGAVFSGQGSQYVGMGKELYKNSSLAREVFEEANDTLKFDLMKLCFEGNENELMKAENCQPAVVTLSTALYRVFINEFGIKPNVYAGHSLGEYSSLTCEGTISFSKVLEIVKKRGELLGAASIDGGMAAIIGIDSDIISDYCNDKSNKNGILSISNYNTERQTVLSGNLRLIDEASVYFENIGATVKKLNVSGGFHSLLMSDAAAEFKNFLKDYEFLSPKYEVISNIDGLPYKDGKDIKEKLVKQIVQPVRWVNIMDYFSRMRINTVIEFGPKKTLRNFFKSTEEAISAFAFDDFEDYTLIRDRYREPGLLAEIYRDFIERCLGIIACTKNNNSDDRAYKRDVIDRCLEIREIEKEISSYDSNTLELCKKVLRLTKLALNAKSVPQIEQEQRMMDLAIKSGNYELEYIIGL